jgi:hypothetical protein
VPSAPSLPCHASCDTRPPRADDPAAKTVLGGLSGKYRSRNVPLSPLSSKEIDRLHGLMVDRRLRAVFTGNIYTSGVRNRDGVPFSVIDWSEYSIPPLSWCSHSLDRNRGTGSPTRNGSKLQQDTMDQQNQYYSQVSRRITPITSNSDLAERADWHSERSESGRLSSSRRTVRPRRTSISRVSGEIDAIFYEAIGADPSHVAARME